MRKDRLFFIWLAFSQIMFLLFPTAVVQALGTPEIVEINPGSPQPVGTRISVRARVPWDDSFRSMRICFGGTNYCQEDATPDITKTFDTSNLSPGSYTILVQVAGKDDPSWSNPTTASAGFELTGSSNQSQPPVDSSPSQPEQPQSPSAGPGLAIFSMDPQSTIVGEQITVHIKVDTWNPGSTKFNVSCGGVSKHESTEVEFDTIWHTNGCDAGQATITVFTRANDDPNWENPTVSYGYISLAPVQNNAPEEIVPQASFSADQTSLPKGQCTYLHWSTSNANDVDIDGEEVEDNGSLQVCPTVTKKYTLSAHGNNGDVNRNITVVVTTPGSSSSDSSQSPSPSNPQPSNNSSMNFETGDVIEINGDIFVIVDGRRRHVPNPETLDALGISRDRIDNNGLSVEDLLAISRGLDIPDVSRDPGGFENFKSGVFPNDSAIAPNSVGETNNTSQFQNGDVIQIGNDIYIILNGQRRHIPNPETLDMLGIHRSVVENKGLSNADLLDIPIGEDIPDAIIQSNEFSDFVNGNPQFFQIPTISNQPRVQGMSISLGLRLDSPENGISFSRDSDIKFKWGGPGDEYLLLLTGGPYSNTILCGWQTGRSCTIRNLPVGSYTWQVVERNSQNEKESSPQMTFKILPVSGYENDSDDSSSNFKNTNIVADKCDLRCSLSFSFSEISNYWNSHVNETFPYPDVEKESAEDYLIRRGIPIGKRYSDGECKTLANALAKGIPSYGWGNDATHFVNSEINKPDKSATQLISPNDLQDCYTILRYINISGLPGHTAFVHHVDKDTQEIIVIQQNDPLESPVMITPIPFSDLNSESTYYIKTSCY